MVSRKLLYLCQVCCKIDAIMVVAVDGYSSTGKSTVAKLVAARLGLMYIDTGAMYRAVTLKALREGAIDEGGRIDEEKVRELLKGMEIAFRVDGRDGRYETLLNGEPVEDEIRSMRVAESVSGIAALGFVREFLVEQQRELGRKGDVIMDGRDIGSVVFPDADVKFFMTATLQVRTERRYRELKAKGMEVGFEEVEENVKKRDYMDSHREVSPLVQVPDAVVVDNSCMTIEEEVDFMVKIIETKKGNGLRNEGGN